MYKVGQSLASAVDTTAVLVVRAPGADVEITCGGVPMVEGKVGNSDGSVDPAHSGGSVLGKRYVDEALGLELICTKPGAGTLAANGSPLSLKTAKALPASD
jgi:hypothetical protein